MKQIYFKYEKRSTAKSAFMESSWHRDDKHHKNRSQCATRQSQILHIQTHTFLLDHCARAVILNIPARSLCKGRNT